MGSDAAITVRLLEAEAGRNPDVVDQLTRLVNDVYATAECGLWLDGTTRTTSSELAGLVAARQVVVAVRGGRIVGSIQIHDVALDTSEFGMLVAAPDQRGTGVGRALVEFAEQRGRVRGLPAMQLELLVPRAWRHPSKEFLKAWYHRIGYRIISTRSMDDTHPHLAALLATPCDLFVYEKRLREAIGMPNAPVES